MSGHRRSADARTRNDRTTSEYREYRRAWDDSRGTSPPQNFSTSTRSPKSNARAASPDDPTKTMPGAFFLTVESRTLQDVQPTPSIRPGLASLAAMGSSSSQDHRSEREIPSYQRQDPYSRRANVLPFPSERATPPVHSEIERPWLGDSSGLYPNNLSERISHEADSEHFSNPPKSHSGLQYPVDNLGTTSMPTGDYASVGRSVYYAAPHMLPDPESSRPWSRHEPQDQVLLNPWAPGNALPYPEEVHAGDKDVGPDTSRARREAEHHDVPSVPYPMDEVPFQTLSMGGDNILDMPHPIPILANRQLGKIDSTTANKRAQIYDSSKDVEALIKGLKHRQARSESLIAVLPALSHDQMLEVRDEYKKRRKAEGVRTSLPKDIESGTSRQFGTICQVTSLGRWESESHWVKFWYLSRSTDRELIIETLMGRTNAEIKQIRDSFKDKKYSDDLVRCMEKELKADKFQDVVLIVLSARRQEETDPVLTQHVRRDVDILRSSLEARQGGETSMLQLIVTRSDAHLREVLKSYERIYESNFAKEALKKSKSSTGEVIAHVINGVINRPARDALLLRHAVKDLSSKPKTVDLRYELLISRLVRLHWDRVHLARVKQEYRTRYGADLASDVRAATKGDFGEFCLRVCEA